MKKKFFMAGVCLVCFFGGMLLPAFADNEFVSKECVEKQEAGTQVVKELTDICTRIAARLADDTPLTPQEIENIRDQLTAYSNAGMKGLSDCGNDHIVDILKTINLFLPDVVQKQGGNLIVSLDDEICTYFIYPAIVMFFFSISLLLSGLSVQGFMMMSIAIAFYVIYVVCP